LSALDQQDFMTYLRK